jgi:hypothetical protein
MASIADLSLEDLHRIIDEAVDRRLHHLINDFDISDEDLTGDEPLDTRSLEEVFASIKKNRWTPPPGSKSSLELLQEDRGR